MFEVQPCDTIQSIKEKLSVLTKVRANNLLLLLNGAFLENSAILDDYEIDEDTTLAFEIKLCGPKPADYDWSKHGVQKRLRVCIAASKRLRSCKLV